VIGPAFASDLDGVTCVQCGQCAAVCPVGAIVERSAIDDVWAALDDPAKHVIVQTAPAIRAALGEEFGYRPARA
jgi:NADP-reducing hydrogenase subunit HndD